VKNQQLQYSINILDNDQNPFVFEHYDQLVEKLNVTSAIPDRFPELQNAFCKRICNGRFWITTCSWSNDTEFLFRESEEGLRLLKNQVIGEN